MIRNIFRFKKEFLIITALLFLAGIIEVFVFNLNFVSRQFATLQQRSYSIKDGSLANFQLKKGKLLALNNDPNITLENIDLPVKYILLEGCQNRFFQANGQVFYRGPEETFSEDKSIFYNASSDIYSTLLVLPSTKFISSLRLDLTNLDGDLVSCKHFAINPFIQPSISLKRLLFYFLVILLASAYLFRNIGFVQFSLNWADKSIDNICQKIHIQRNTLNLSAFPLFLFLIVIVLSLLRISGSSIAANNRFFDSPRRDGNLLFGNPRAVRSDEWAIFSPWILSQARNGFPTYNNTYLAGQSLTITNIPVKSWETFFKPQNYSYFLLPLEEAFAFNWWFRAFLLTLSIYLLSLRLTKNQIYISAVSGLAFFFSPYIQWWYQDISITLEITSFGIFSFIFFLGLVDNINKKYSAWIHAIFWAYFAICFAFCLYPPFQIPLVILFSLLGIGYCLSKRRKFDKKDFFRLARMLFVSLFLIGIFVTLFYFSNMTVIKTITSTAYPGGRTQLGGNGWQTGLFLKLMSGFYNVQLLNDARTIPNYFVNQSEASSFFFFAIFLLPYVIYIFIRDKKYRENTDPLLVWSMIALAVFIVWTTIGFGSIITKLLLLDYSTIRRSVLIFGVLNHILLIFFIARVNITWSRGYKIISILYSILIVSYFIFFGNFLKEKWPLYINSDLLIYVIAIIIGIMVLLMLFQQKIIFFTLLLLFSIGTTYKVNPLYRGLSALNNPQVVSLAKMTGAENPQGAWIVYDDFNIANYLAANGLQVLNGTYYYPNLKFWSKFDQQGQYLRIYNRYANVYILPIPDDNQVNFRLQQPDLFQMEISPCNPVLKDVGIQYYWSASPLEGYSCISPLTKIEFTNRTVYIYQRVQ